MAAAVDCPTQPMGAVSDDDDLKSIAYEFTDSDDDGGPFDMETTCPGQKFTKEEEEEIGRSWLKRYIDLSGDYADLHNKFLVDEIASIPPRPLKVLPETTKLCIKRGYCYHREYMTNETYETSQVLGFCEPMDMLQVLCLRLSHTESCPISVYGIFAIRDDLEPLRNYVFNSTRDDPIMIEKDSFALPLCSPCRGMYVLDRALLEVDLWMKKDGDRSTDEHLLSLYVEITLRSLLDEKLTGRIQGDRCMLDMSYMFLAESVEATIQISALADNPSHVRFIAFSRCFENDIILFEGKGIMKGELIQYVIAVKVEEELDVRLELDDSVVKWTFENGAVVSNSRDDLDDSVVKWTFKDGAVVSSSRDDLIRSQFQVKVFSAPKEQAPVTSRYIDWEIRCRRSVESIAG